MLNDAALAAARTMQEAGMPDLCNIERLSLESDGMGGFEETWSVSGSAVACRIGPTGRLPEERELAGRLGDVMPLTLTLPAATDVKADDRIVVPSPLAPLPGGEGERRFEVAGVVKRSYETARRVVCVEIS